MSSVQSRVIQWFVILLILIGGTLGYFYYQSHAAINQKAATNNGLMGYWSFDEGVGTDAGDASGNGNTGTLVNGPTWVDGIRGKALNFSGGTGGYTLVGDKVNVSSITISSWVYVSADAAASVWPGIVSKGNNSQYSIYQEQSSSSINAFVQTTSGQKWCAIKTSVPKFTWHYVTMTYDSGTGQFLTYYDGNLASSCPTSGNIITTSSPLQIGSSLGGSQYVFNGKIDEVRMYNRALSATEIANLYNLGATKINTATNSNMNNGLVALWPFNGADISGTTVYDRSGNGNNGTRSGTTEASGKLGQALSFNGTSDYISYGTNIEFNSADFTIAAWFKLTGDAGGTDGDAMIFSQRVGTVGDGQPLVQLYVRNSEDKLHAQIRDSVGAIVDTTGVTTINQGEWYHGVMVKTSSALTLYVNGVNEKSTTHSLSGDFDAGAISRYLGKSRSVGTDVGFLKGSLDDVRVYSRALSESDIRDLYQAGVSDKVNSASSQGDTLKNGLVGYWKFDENTGTATVDSSTNGNDGTLTNGPTWTTGRIGSAVNFDGVDDRITMGTPSTLDMKDTLSISAWIYPRSYTSGGNRGRIVDKNGDGVSGFALGMNNQSMSAGIGLILGNLYVFNSPANSITLNTWQNVILTIDTNKLATMYINGINVSSATLSAFPTTSTNNFVIGGRTTDNIRNFDGLIDEVRIYNRALSADEAAKLYQTTTSDNPDTNLKGYWSFNGADISGTTAYDRSGNSNNGTLINDPTKVSGKIGQGLSFDGSNDFINVGSAGNLDNLGPLSICAWIYPTTWGGGGYGRIFDKSGAGGILAFYTDNTSGVQTLRFTAPFVTTTLAASAQNYFVVLGQWQYTCVTWDGTVNTTGIKFYSNGTINTSYTVTTTGAGARVSDASYDALIGNRLAGDRGFSGLIDELRVYGRVLSTAEISNLYNMGR